MAAYSSKAKRIKNALMTVLTGLQLDTGSGDEPAFASVIDHTRNQFDNYPAMRVLPGHVDTDKASVSQNDRTVAFMLLGHLPLEDQWNIPGDAFDRMLDLTEIVLDALDVGDASGVLTDIDATLGTWIMNATRGDWTTEATQAGAQLTWNINVEVRYTKDL